jgi:hypothetical protein
MGIAIGQRVAIKGRRSNNDARRLAVGKVIAINGRKYDVEAGVQGQGLVVLAQMDYRNLVILES